MKSRSRKLIAIAATLLTLLQPPLLWAVEASQGIGGTGHSVPESGVGGTGNSTDKEGIARESGIGGTGIVANKAGIGGTGHTQGEGGIGGTGIVGTITGFGSIWVNGLEVEYDAKTRVVTTATATNTNELAIGQVVVIEAQGGNTLLQANKISVVNAVAGPISESEMDAGSGKLTVLGQTVTVTAKTLTHDRQGSLDPIQLKRGEHVKVSGLRKANGDIVASRIERTAPIAESSLVGPITGIDGNMIYVYAMQVSVATVNGLSVGQEISAIGQLDGGILTAREITLSPSAELYGRTEHVNLQGYAGAGTATGQIKVGNVEVVVSDPSLIAKALASDEPVQISGHFANDHRLVADRIEFSRDRPDRVQYDNVGDRDNGSSDRVERGGHVERAERGDHADRPDKPDRPDHADHSDAQKQSDHSH